MSLTAQPICMINIIMILLESVHYVLHSVRHVLIILCVYSVHLDISGSMGQSMGSVYRYVLVSDLYYQYMDVNHASTSIAHHATLIMSVTNA